MRYLKDLKMESDSLTMLEVIQGIQSLLKDKYGLIVSVFKRRESFQIYVSTYLNEDKIKDSVVTTIKSFFNKNLECSTAQVERTGFGYEVTFKEEAVEELMLETTQVDNIGSKETYLCSICGKKHEGWGNNPWPISTNPSDRACDDCNMKHVIPARMKDLYKTMKSEAVDKNTVTKGASNAVLDDKYIWLFSVLDEDGSDIEEGIDILEDAIEVLVDQQGTFLVGYPYVDPNPEDPNVEVVFADNPGPILIYNHEKASVTKDNIKQPTVTKKNKEDY